LSRFIDTEFCDLVGFYAKKESKDFKGDKGNKLIENQILLATKVKIPK